MDEHQVHRILFFLDRLLFARESYELIKADEEERKKSKMLGRRALVYDIIILIFIGGAAALVAWGSGFTDEESWKMLLIVIATVIIFIIMIPYYLLAFSFSIKQLKLNKRAIGWIALLLPILTTIAAGVVIAVFAF